MDNPEQYTIDTNLLKDIKCNSHDYKKKYNKYCFNCNKNLCDLCEGHNNHKIRNFISMEQSPDIYRIYEEKLEKMESISRDYFKKKLYSAKQKQNEIQKKLEEINNIIIDINKTTELFEKHLNFNKTIINAYKEGEINYYIINNFNNLIFDVDINNYERKWNLNKFNFNNDDNKNLKHQRNKSLLEPINIHASLDLTNVINNQTSKMRKKYLDDKPVLNLEGFTNMWISERYCKEWGLKEGIRELLQNQYDGVISKIKTKDNLKVIQTGKKVNIDNRNISLNFDLINKKDNKTYGQIIYNYKKETLTISNEGILWLGDFLLGGTKSEKNNSDLIGKFGEGMKLAILALCRLGKNVTIISSNKKYSFRIKEDPLFLKDGEPQRCLHFKYETFKNSNENIIQVIIDNIDKEEWGKQIINFLWLSDDDAQIYTSFNNYNEEIGQILCENYLKGKLYVKGIYVQNIKSKSGEDKPNCLGFNIDVPLDRDRSCIPNYHELKRIIAFVLSCFCNKNIKNILEEKKEKQIIKKENKKGSAKIKLIAIDCSKKECEKIIQNPVDCNKKDSEKMKLNPVVIKAKKDNFINIEENKKQNIVIEYVQVINYDKIFMDIYNLLENNDVDIINSYNLANSLSQECIEYFWKKTHLNEDKNKNPVEKYDNHVQRFIKEKNLSEDFYPYFEVNYIMFDILRRAKDYISIEKKFSLYVENATNIEPKGIYKSVLNEIYSKVKMMDKSFDGKIIFFKKFEREEKDFCYTDKNKINFSALKLTEEINNSWKFWIFVKILQFLKIKIEDNYEYINNLFEDEETYPFDESGVVI